jgi:hypothetical protein
MMISVPVCPFCGCELRLQKAFGGYAYGGNHADDCYVGMVKIFDSEKAAYAAAVKRVEPENRVLTLEEVCTKETLGFLEIKDNDDWNKAIICMGAKQGKYIGVAYVNNILAERAFFPPSFYKRVWRCWLRKPTDEERANAPWEEQSDD